MEIKTTIEVTCIGFPNTKWVKVEDVVEIINKIENDIKNKIGTNEVIRNQQEGRLQVIRILKKELK